MQMRNICEYISLYILKEWILIKWIYYLAKHNNNHNN